MNITVRQFDEKLLEILSDMTAEQLISIPGIYEIVSEELNNDVIGAIEADRQTEEDLED